MTLIYRLDALGEYGQNALDVEIEIALFKPSYEWRSVRANDAGTKVIYTDTEGDEYTFWPKDWSMRCNRKETLAALRAMK